MAESGRIELPATVRPLKYALELEPNFDDFSFRGRESIEIQVEEPSKRVVLNAIELKVQSCTAKLVDGTELAAADTSFDGDAETVAFTFPQELPAGKATLLLEFSGELNDKLHGFYRSRYTDQNGEPRYLATTQFEATDARRAFPCWDEPAHKARFQVTLTVPSDMAAISNMQVASETSDRDGLKRVEFAETPPMSTYLIAFVVGDLRAIEDRASDGTLMRVWATTGNEEHGRFALDVSVKLLAYFNDYFGIPYPHEKLDHLAIPDFAAGAMENWGAITYRETAILVDPAHSSAFTRQTVASIVAHEMAHMWFGDLVTMAWWNDLWLNESFASWMGDKAVDHLFPEWDMWTQFVSADTNRALALDGLRNSHPIEQKVDNPAEIRQLFDAISYSKGGSILRMLEDFLGADAFRSGLRSYISKHQYSNATTVDLWNALAEASGQPVAEMMSTWVDQTGYPVVDVRASATGETIQIEAVQSRFLYEHLLDTGSKDESLWRVPLTAAGPDGESRAATLMTGRSASLTLPRRSVDGESAWTKVNPEQTGFYRVNYDADGWSRVLDAVQSMAVSARDRLGVQNDAYALSRAGYLPVTQFLEVATAYRDETDATVWEDLAANLSGLDYLLADETFLASFQGFARRLFRPIGESVGWVAQEGEGHLDAILRSTVLSALGSYDDVTTLKEAASRFAQYAAEADRVSPDIRGVVLSLAARRGDRATYDTMWALREDATLEEEKVRLLGAITRFEVPELLDDALERSLEPERVRVHDTVRVVSGVATNRLGRDRAWEFVKANWAEFDRRYGAGDFGLQHLVSLTGRFTTQQRLDDVSTFFETNPTPAAERTIRQSLERIKLNVAWLERNRDELGVWFEKAGA